MIQGADLGATSVAKREDWEFKANWKLQNDNWETYHHIWVHKGIFNKISDDLEMKTGRPWSDTLQWDNLVTLKTREGRPPRSDSGGYGNAAHALPSIPMPPGVEHNTCTSIIFPNVTLTVSNNHLASVITDPIAPDRTVGKLGFFFVGEAAKAKKYVAGRKQVLDRWLGKSRSVSGGDGIRSQDFGVWEVQQIARQSPVADEVVFSPVWERNIHHFHNQLLDTIQG